MTSNITPPQICPLIALLSSNYAVSDTHINDFKHAKLSTHCQLSQIHVHDIAKSGLLTWNFSAALLVAPHLAGNTEHTFKVTKASCGITWAVVQAKEEESGVQIAVLAAELKRTQWEKGIVEQQAETLKTALAVWTGRSSQVCFMILFTHSVTPSRNVSMTHVFTCSPTHTFIC